MLSQQQCCQDAGQAEEQQPSTGRKQLLHLAQALMVAVMVLYLCQSWGRRGAAVSSTPVTRHKSQLAVSTARSTLTSTAQHTPGQH